MQIHVYSRQREVYGAINCSISSGGTAGKGELNRAHGHHRHD